MATTVPSCSGRQSFFLSVALSSLTELWRGCCIFNSVLCARRAASFSSPFQHTLTCPIFRSLLFLSLERGKKAILDRTHWQDGAFKSLCCYCWPKRSSEDHLIIPHRGHPAVTRRLQCRLWLTLMKTYKSCCSEAQTALASALTQVHGRTWFPLGEVLALWQSLPSKQIPEKLI